MSTTEQPPQYTHIPLVYRSEDSEKAYGTIVLEGAITDAQIDELRANLRAGEQYRPDLLAVNMNRLSDDWHAMVLDEMTVETTHRPRFTEEFDEHLGTVDEFITAVKTAAAQQWKLPGTLHITVNADDQRHWAAALAALRDFVASLADMTDPADHDGLTHGLTLTGPDGRDVGSAWLTY
jgi:hypothetical protein